MDCCTSCSATSILRLRLNCRVITELRRTGGSHLLESGHLSELTFERRGYADAITSGLAPG